MTTIDKAQQKEVLTSFIQSYMNDQTDFVASKIAPSMPVLRRTGERFNFGHEAMRLHAGKRAVWGRYKTVDFEVNKVDTWNLVDNGFSSYVLQEELDNKELPIQADQAKLKLLAQIMLLNYEHQVAAGITTSTVTNNTTLAGNSQWSDYTNSNPVIAIDDAKESIRKASWKKANSIFMSRSVFVKLRRHPKIIELFKNVTMITDQLLEDVVLRDILGFQNVAIGSAQYADVNLWQATPSTFTDIWGDKCLIYHSNSQGELWDTMFMRTFEMKTGIQAGSFATTEEQKLTEKKMSGVVTSHERDVVIVDNRCAYLFDDCLA